MLKQADYKDNKLVFEIECLNCRKYNYLSEKSYFHLRKGCKMPQISSINHRLPSEMNVIFVSMERCGISWIVRTLDRIHREMFKESIIFHPEISQVKATRERFKITEKGILNSDGSLYHKGWYNVYDVNPLDLLKKNYDRVIIIKREKSTLLKVHEIYYPPDLSKEQQQRFREKDLEIYDKIYEQKINDHRCLMVNLEDLNNYTVATFTKLMDFLNFPESGRPKILPVTPPERNFEAFSSILNINQPLNKRLTTMIQTFKLTQEGFLQQIIDNKGNNLKKVTLNSVIIIGPREHKGCHVSENLLSAFRKKGYNVKLLSLEELGYGTNSTKQFTEMKEAYPLSKAIEIYGYKPELIVFDEPAWFFYNDMDIPVFYTHREFKRPPKVFYPDVAMFWTQSVVNYFRIQFAPYWCQQIPLLTTLWIAVDLDRYKPQEKTIEGIVHLAGREPMDGCLDMKELTALGCLYHGIREMEEVQDYVKCIADENGGLTDERFREYLSKVEALWIYIPAGQYVSRRILEAMACKTICVIKLENQEHEATLRNMGFIAGEHYIKINSLKEMKKLNDNWNYNDYKDMIEKAYKVVTEKHSYLNRVDQIVDLYSDFALRYKGVFIQ